MAYDSADYLESCGVFGEPHADDDTASWFSDAVSSVAHAATSAVNTVAHAAQPALSAITNNPAWDIARTGASFIPGVGSAVSAGMSAAAAAGRGESLKDIALDAAIGAIPGGPAVQAAAHIAVGALRGQRLDQAALDEIRRNVPGGVAGRAAFDGALAVMRGQHLDQAALNAARTATAAGLDAFAGAEALRVFDAAIKGAKDGAAASVHQVYTHLPVKVAAIATQLHQVPAMRLVPSGQLAKQVNASSPAVRQAIAAFVNRFAHQDALDPRDVADFDSAEASAKRARVSIPAGIHTLAVTSPVVAPASTVPRIRVSRELLLRMYRAGNANVRKSILVHGHLARVARDAGELFGTDWIVRSGDLASTIAKKLTGDSNRWRELRDTNTVEDIPDFNKLRIGQRIHIPSSWLPTAPPPVPGAPPVVPPPTVASSTDGPPFPPPSKFTMGFPTSVYIVKSGETGSGIARDITGDPNRWRELRDANPSTNTAHAQMSGNGMDIFAGQKLTLPRSWVAVAIPVPPPVVVPPVVVAPPVPGAPPVVVPSLPPGTPPLPPPPSIPAVVPAPPAAATLDDTAWSVASTSADAKKVLGVVQALLVTFNVRHGDTAMRAMGYGTQPEDLSGIWLDRSSSAMAAFQAWANANGKGPMAVRGLPSTRSVTVLQDVVAKDLAGGSGVAPVVPLVPPTSQPPAASKDGGGGGGGGLGPLVLGAVLAKAAGWF